MSQPRDTMLASNAFDDDQWLSEPPADDASFADEELTDEPPPNTPEDTAAYVAMDQVWGMLALAIAVIVSIVMIVRWLSQ